MIFADVEPRNGTILKVLNGRKTQTQNGVKVGLSLRTS